MDTDKLFELARPYLEKNDFGIAHTQRVFELAKLNFPVKPELQELTYTSIIFHDIGIGIIKPIETPHFIGAIIFTIPGPDTAVISHLV